MKNTNALLILNTVRHSAPISRTDLVRKVGLTSASVINITNDMIQHGLIIQNGKTNDGGQGRKSLMLAVNPAAAYVIGVQLSAEEVYAGAYNFNNDVIVHTRLEVDSNASSDRIIKKIEDAIGFCIKRIDSGRVLGIGMALPGPLNVTKGILINPPNFPGLINVPIKAIIEERFGVPVCCDRESNTAVLAEYAKSLSEGFKSVFFVSLFKKGIGGGFISNGNVLHGFCDGAGEIGHTTVDISGPRCSCGNFGCLEALVSENTILSKAKKMFRINIEDSEEGLEEPESIEEVFYRSNTYNSSCRHIVNEAAGYVAQALGNVISLYSPELIVLGGSLPQMSPQFVEMIKNKIHARMYPIHSKEIIVRPTSLDTFVFVTGAAEMAWNMFLPNLLDSE